MRKRGKRYLDAAGRIDPERLYAPTAGLALVTDTVCVNYDPTVDLAVRLGVDPRHADQMVRGAIPLPHGTGKAAKVAVVAEGAQAQAAEEAGADYVGPERVTQMIESGELDVDAVLATPDQMTKLGRYGRVLGPRGLMPNPKSGTVTTDVASVVSEIKAGRIEYRTDRYGNIHVPLGKASFPVRDLAENYGAVIDELLSRRPSAQKGRYLRASTVSTSQGPPVRLDPRRTQDVWRESELEAA